MSLAQHVSSIEGPDRLELPIGTEDDLHNPLLPLLGHKTVRRVISYDAFPPSNDDEIPLNAVSAYKFSDAHRAGTVF